MPKAFITVIKAILFYRHLTKNNDKITYNTTQTNTLHPSIILNALVIIIMEKKNIYLCKKYEPLQLLTAREDSYFHLLLIIPKM